MTATSGRFEQGAVTAGQDRAVQGGRRLFDVLADVIDALATGRKAEAEYERQIALSASHEERLAAVRRVFDLA